MPLKDRLLVIALLLIAYGGARAEGIAVSGRVLGPGGAPVADSPVDLVSLLDEAGQRRAMLQPDGEQPVSQAKTNAAGRFRLQAPRAGLWRVRISAEGFVPLVTDLRPLIEPVELQDATLQDDSKLNVVVVDASGKPVAGASVMIWADGGRRFVFRGSPWRIPPRFSTTDEAGKTSLPRAELENIALSVMAAGHVFVERRDVRGTAARLTLTTGKPAEVEVVSSDESVEAGVLLSLGRGSHPAGFTDDHGLLSVTIAPGKPVQLLLATEDGRRLKSELELAVPEPEPDGEGVDDNDEDAKIEQRRFKLPEQFAVVGQLIDSDTRSPLVGGLVWDAELPDAAAISDESGRFSLIGPPNASWQLSAGADGYLSKSRMGYQPIEDRSGPTIALDPAAAVEGRVVNDEGQPLADVEVELRIKPGPPGVAGRAFFRVARRGGLRTVSSAGGTFRLSPVDPELTWLVRAVSEGYAPAEAAVGVLEPRRIRSKVELRLTAGLTVSGTVVDEDGTPLGNVTVELKAAAEKRGFSLAAMTGEDTVYPARSAADGRFAIHDLPAGKFDLEASRTGFATRKLAGIEIDDSKAPFDVGQVVLKPGQTISGYITDPEGQAVEGVEVRRSSGPAAWMMALREPTAADAVSDPTGWFAIHDLAAGETYTVNFQRSGFVPKSLRAVKAPRQEPLMVEIEPASEVRGRVLNDDGDPVAGARMYLTRARGAMGRVSSGQSPLAVTQSDGEGRFLFEGIEPGPPASLVGLAPGYQEGRLEDLEILQGENLEQLELHLERGAVLEGQVTAPDGRPAIEARVRKINKSQRMTLSGDAVTDGDGRYRLEGLTVGEVSIEATHQDYPRVVRDVELRDGVNHLALTFEGGVEVCGRVVDAAGNPVLDAAVQLAPAGRTWGGPNARSVVNGSFEILGVQDGDYSVSVEAAGYALTEAAQTLTVDGEAIDGLELQLSAGGAIYGTVRGLDAEALGRVNVRATAGSYRNSGAAAVDFQGQYRIEHLQPGNYRVVASAPGSGRQAQGTATIEPDSPEVALDLEFADGFVLSGTALQGEEPVVGVSLAVRGVDVDYSNWTQTDPDGSFELQGLEAGSYELMLRDWRTGLSHDETIELRGNREIVLRVPTAAIRGEVVDAAENRPLSGVTLFAERTIGSGNRPVTLSVTSDSAGEFTIGNAADGEWRLTADKQGYAALAETVVIQSGQDPAKLRLAMDATEGLTLQVRLPAGGIPDHVLAAILDGSGATLVAGSYATGEGGRVRLSSVPSGQWELLISAPGAATTSLAVTSPGPTTTVHLRPVGRLIVRLPELLEPGNAATVRIVGEDGRPFRSLGWGGSTIAEWRLRDGRLELSSMPPGNWIVRVGTADGREWQARATTTAGGTSELVLE